MAYQLQEHVRGYPDIVRPDSSIELRNKMRAYWGRGEQLWDVDFNSNLKFAEDWVAFSIDFYRLPFPSWPRIPETGTYKTVLRVGGGEALAGDIVLLGSGDQLLWRPFTGAKIHIRADYVYRGWDGAAWRVFCEVPVFKQRMEIAIFISAARPNIDAVRYEVQEAFEMPPLAMFSSARNLGGEAHIAYLHKNGTQVGYFQQNDQGVATLNPVPENLSFAAGDILSIRSPVALRNAAFTIVGKRL